MPAKPSLEHVFSVRLRFPEGPRIRFKPAFSEFKRGFVSIAGGDVYGPKLNGRVIPHSGGDWPMMWQSGLIEFEAHYMLETDDGTPIYIHNRGIAYSAPETVCKIEAGESVSPDETYLRITPRFEVSEGKHDWLGRTIFVGTAERQGNETQFEYFAVY
jgi:hypothetical protein